MKKLLIMIVAFGSHQAFGQKVVFDKYHFATVNENGAVRQAAELTNQKYYDKVNDNLEKVRINTATIVLAQTMIYESLANVNSALKNGKNVIQMGATVQRIITYTNYMLDAAKSNPGLILFAQGMASEAKLRALRLINDVSGVILKQGNNVLMDYNARDQLLMKVNQELQILEGLTYGGYIAMMDASQAGIMRKLNPFSAYIANDKNMASDIVIKSQMLHR